MTTPLMWPSTLAIDNIVLQIENTSRGGGPSLSGKELVVGAPTGRWTAKFDVTVGRRDEVFCFRAVMGLLKGRANTILISPCESGYSPAGIATGIPTLFTTHKDGTPFSDGTRYRQDATYSYLVSPGVTLDTSATIYCKPGPKAGQYFSLVDDKYRMHLITRVFAAATANQYRINFEPPLRSGYSVKKALKFDRPFSEMRLTADLAGELSRSRASAATPSLAFVEVF